MAASEIRRVHGGLGDSGVGPRTIYIDGKPVQVSSAAEATRLYAAAAERRATGKQTAQTKRYGAIDRRNVAVAAAGVLSAAAGVWWLLRRRS